MKRDLYEIYNINKGFTGEPFGMCAKHYKEWIKDMPNYLMVSKIAENTTKTCNECDVLKLIK